MEDILELRHVRAILAGIVHGDGGPQRCGQPSTFRHTGLRKENRKRHFQLSHCHRHDA
jgi:hypothetical protein